MRGRLDNGAWLTPFDPYFPYYEYLYREANAWQSTFFAPHDPQGLVNLYGSNEAFEAKLDSMFAIPWKGYEAHNLSGFIGQYCHGNQPDHSTPYMYYFIGKQEKAQIMLDSCMSRFYGMGKEGLAYAGMDDAGEMSAWYVFNAIGLYTFSPADPQYIVSVPLFDKVFFSMNDIAFTISKRGRGKKITALSYGDAKIDGYFISHEQLLQGKELVVESE
jgi:putative alpha-1,2-mannosidase